MTMPLPKQPVMLRDTNAQDRVIEPPKPWNRHRALAIGLTTAAAALGVLALFLWKYSGAGASVSRERLTIAAVERGSFVRDVAADGQVVAAVSPTLYAGVAGTVTLKGHAGDTRRHEIPIVGIVDRLQVPWARAGGWGGTFFENSIIEPFRYAAKNSHYVVRAKPGQLAAVMQASQKRLFEVNRGRVLESVQTITEARADSYRDDRGLAVILGVVCAALLAVTAFGIVGLTSYWVTQRRRQIGIRRALGATRSAITRYFQTENLLIASTGAALGVALAIALNLWMVNSFEMARLHVSYALFGALVVLLLGQLAVLWPALRAASIPPALATRSA